jgi:aryl-alcohol dehydrogenase-like predicted oxidoreductase
LSRATFKSPKLRKSGPRFVISLDQQGENGEMALRKKRMGKTELDLSVIGLGTWAMGGGGWKWGWGPQDDKASIATIRRGIELGINWVDTAPIYGFGRSEEVVGQALSGISDKPLVVTKCSRIWDEQRNVTGSLEEKSLRAELEASLRRLRLDTIDLYLMHYPLPEGDMEKGWETLSRFVEEGKARYIGVSNISLPQIKRLQQIHPIACIQPAYSMLERSIELETITYCAANGIGIVAYSPIQRGLLTGSLSREKILEMPEDDHRKRDKHFIEPELGPNLELVEGLKKLGRQVGKTPAQIAIAWALRHEAVTGAIVGARSPLQIEETVQAGYDPLPESAIEEIEALLGTRSQAMGSR